MARPKKPESPTHIMIRGNVYLKGNKGLEALTKDSSVVLTKKVGDVFESRGWAKPVGDASVIAAEEEVTEQAPAQ